MAKIQFDSKLITIGGGTGSVYLRIPNALAFNILGVSPGTPALLTVDPDKPLCLQVSLGRAKKKQKKT
jgi:hypothetical protein